VQLRTDYVLSFSSSQERLKHLSDLPANLDEAYERLLRRLVRPTKNAELIEFDIQENSFKILSWVFYARQPLSIGELSEALAVQPNVGDLEKKCLMQPDEILDCCRGFIIRETSSDTLRFTHATAKKFLQDRFPVTLQAGEVELALACLRYLAFNVFDYRCDTEAMKERLNAYKFSLYAARFWGIHTRGKAENDTDVQQAVLSLLTSENKRNSMLQMEAYANSGWGNISFTKGQTSLHVIAGKGLARICEHFLKGMRNEMYLRGITKQANSRSAEKMLAAKDEHGRTPLYVAIERGDSNVVEALLTAGADGQTELYVAAEKDQEIVLRTLLLHGVDGELALLQAAREGNENLAAMLVRQKVRRTAVNNDQWTALHWAALYSHQRIVWMLLEANEDGVLLGDECTALHLAAFFGHDEVVRMLLSDKTGVMRAQHCSWQRCLGTTKLSVWARRSRPDVAFGQGGCRDVRQSGVATFISRWPITGPEIPKEALAYTKKYGLTSDLGTIRAQFKEIEIDIAGGLWNPSIADSQITSSRLYHIETLDISMKQRHVYWEYNNGDIYEGGWDAAQQVPHGSGLYIWASGVKYEGSWRRGRKHGFGTQTYPNH